MSNGWMKQVRKQCETSRAMTLWKMGQSGFLVHAGGKWVGLDLYLSDHPMRVSSSIVSPEELEDIDIIYGSHDHPDHIDTEAWKRILEVNDHVIFIVPAAVKDEVAAKTGIPKARLAGLEDGERVHIGKFTFTGVASAHEFPDRDPETGKYLYMGTVMEIEGVQIYQPGDTCLYEGLTEKLRSFGTLDVMILPINGRSGDRLKNGIVGNMTYQEAVDFAGTLKPNVVIPSHYDMFRGNLEDPEKFSEYIQVKYPEQNYWIGEVGEAFGPLKKG